MNETVRKFESLRMHTGSWRLLRGTSLWLLLPAATIQAMIVVSNKATPNAVSWHRLLSAATRDILRGSFERTEYHGNRTHAAETVAEGGDETPALAWVRSAHVGSLPHKVIFSVALTNPAIETVINLR
ncbi:hypothetical protein GGR57DRAFT_361547 [Xylariaceae sp. FL1272]|nr:hypothetical protein GGR57DRAFT_361547 [Xylariaceae sp. FL1272]